jgi:hypothetical protein
VFISANPVRVTDERFETATEEEEMTQFALTTYQPDGPPPPSVDMERVIADLMTLSEELKARGAWVFASHLQQASAAKVVRDAKGQQQITDGPYFDGDEHVGGITIVEASDLNEALEWGRKLAGATTLPVEVRPFLANRDGLE